VCGYHHHTKPGVHGLRTWQYFHEAIDMKSTDQPHEDTVQLSALRLKCDPVALEKAMLEVDISITGFFYAVDFGPGVRPQYHRVGKNAICTCYLGELCPAVDVVRAYLSAGGQAPPDPPPGYYPVIPARCPICHAPVTCDFQLSSHGRGAGWRCEVGGTAHYWQRMVEILAWKFACKEATRLGLPPPEPLPADLW
jgi:hypothetical protein